MLHIDEPRRRALGSRVQSVLDAHPRTAPEQIPYEQLTRRAQIIWDLQRGLITHKEAERQLDQDPLSKGLRLTRNNPNEGWHEAEDKKRSFGKAALGMGLTVAGGVGGGQLASLGNASGAAGAAGMASFPAAAYTGGAGTTIPLGTLGAGTAGAGAGAAGAATKAATGAAVATKSSMLPQILAAGGLEALSSLLAGGQQDRQSYSTNDPRLKPFIDPKESLYNAMRAINSLGLGVSRQASQPRTVLGPTGLSGGRSLPNYSQPGLNTDAGGGAPGFPNDLTQQFQGLLNPGTAAPRTPIRRRFGR